MAYSDTSDEEVDLNNPNLDAALHQAEQLLGIPPEQPRYADLTCSKELSTRLPLDLVTVVGVLASQGTGLCI